ncbi:hypothetical protein PUR29_36820 [Methylobacterium ajmalii]|uniref:Uncharacterized protein n=1 Tax=Methylobacterium ajmalii TaxID=2738439 RepID=A0ABV0A618_9HYPH
MSAGFDRRNLLLAGVSAAAGLPSSALSQTISAEKQKEDGPSIKIDRVFEPFSFAEDYDEIESKYFNSLGLDTELANGPWEMLLSTLGRYVDGGDPKNVQMVTAPRPANWNDKKYGQWRLSKVIGDAMPAWGTSYQPNTSNSFGSSYAIYITNIVIPVADQNLQAQINTAKRDWVAATTALSNSVSTSGDRWSKFNRKQSSLPPSKRKDFDWWYSNLELKFLKPKENDVLLTGQTYSSLINKAGKGWQAVANLVNKYSDLSATYLVAAEGAEEDRRESVYRYLVGQSLDDFIESSIRNNPQTIADYDKSSTRKHVDQTSWGANASYGFFIRASGSGGSSHINWQTEEFKMKFSAKGIQSFEIVAGDWLSSNLIKMWNILDFQPDGPIDRAIKKKMLWGKDGIFNLRSATAIVVYEPTIEIKLSKADYDRTASWWSGSTGIGIGPFSFGASAGGSKEDVIFNSGTNSIIAKDTTGIPKIIAIVTEVLPQLK